MAKRIQVSTDDTTYYTLPGNTGDLNSEANQITDTIFGQEFASTEIGLINWSISSNALYKGFAGYTCKILKQDLSAAMTGEACSQVSGQVYAIDDATKNLWNPYGTFVVYDNGSDVTAEVETYNFLFGEITFKSTYTVVGAITVDGSYFTKVEIANARTFTLTQNAEAVDKSSISAARANGGYAEFESGLKTVSLDLSGIYSLSNAFKAALLARTQVIVEINPDNSDLSVARGIFKYASQGQSGDVGALEEETISLVLNVPSDSFVPFAWSHDGSTTLSTAVRTMITAWEDGTELYARYLEDGVAGDKGSVIVTDLSLTGGLESMNEFAVTLQGTGALTAV